MGAPRAKLKSLRAACCAKSNFATEARKKLDFTNHFGLIIPLLSSIPIKDIDF